MREGNAMFYDARDIVRSPLHGLRDKSTRTCIRTISWWAFSLRTKKFRPICTLVYYQLIFTFH